MNASEPLEDIELESKVVRGARLTFLGSLLFWPLFLFATSFMLGAPGKTAAAQVERHVLVDSTWCYPLAVAAGWLLCKRGLRLGRPDAVCLLPWLLPALVIGYWLGYLLL